MKANIPMRPDEPSIACESTDAPESLCDSCRSTRKGACRRAARAVFLLDERYDPIALSDGAESPERLLELERTASELSSLVRRHLASRERGFEGRHVEIVNGDELVRVLQLRGALAGYVVLVEPLRRRRPAADATDRYRLSRRESEVLEDLLQGQPSAEIAGELGISEATVLSHIRNIGVKMRCTQRSEIVARAQSTMGRVASGTCPDSLHAESA
jgi:DNA-binding CsgD family transcriptional regulator